MTTDRGFAFREVNTTNGRYLDLYDPTKYECTSPKIMGNYNLDMPESWADDFQGSFAVSAGAVTVRALEAITKRKGEPR